MCGFVQFVIIVSSSSICFALKCKDDWNKVYAQNQQDVKVAHITHHTNITRDLKTTRSHLMPPQQHVCNGLTRPAWLTYGQSAGTGRITRGQDENTIPLMGIRAQMDTKSRQLQHVSCAYSCKSDEYRPYCVLASPRLL